MTFLLFDLYTAGHHPTYIKYVVQHWRQSAIADGLKVVVAPEFMTAHPEIVALSEGYPSIQFTPISNADAAELQHPRSAIAKSFLEWSIFCRYARQLGATQAFLLYLDSLQLPLSFGENAPCPVSAIYFRPALHYHQFPNHPSNRKEIIRRWRQTLILKKILSRPWFKTLFCLDEFSVPAIQKFAKQAHIVHLPDPVQPHFPDLAEVEQIRSTLALTPDRKIFLLFGELSDRKGIYPLFDAIAALPDAIAQQISVLLVGKVNAADREKVQAQVKQLQTKSQVILCDRYIQDEEVQSFFELADIVLAPYQNHVGMSSILLHAAAAQKPVISSNYGLMGALAREYQLGWLIDANDPKAIATAIESSLAPDPQSFDPVRMKAFVQHNHPTQFMNVICSELGLRVTSRSMAC